MYRIEYWNIVNDKLNELIFDFKQRVEESIDDEFISETRLSEIKKLWEITDYRIGFNGNLAVYESGRLYNPYIELSTGKRDYNSDKHLECDAYWNFSQWLKGEKLKIPEDLTNQIKKNYFQKLETEIDSNVKRTELEKLKQSLIEKDFLSLKNGLISIFSSIPYSTYKVRESYFHSHIHLVMKLIGFDIISKLETNIGRIDMKIELNNCIYIIEFKLGKSAQKALNQIREKKYAEPFLNKGKQICMIGISFDEYEKNVNDLKSECL